MTNENQALDAAIERALAAQIYEVVIHPAEFPHDDAYCIMQAPDFIVQIGSDFDEPEAAKTVCARLNMRAAIAAFMADAPMRNDVTPGEISFAKAYCAKIAKELECH